jgi:hypothetical protein
MEKSDSAAKIALPSGEESMLMTLLIFNKNIITAR